MAGYRNRMVNSYKEITPSELFAIVKNHLGDFDIFNREIVLFLRAYKSNTSGKT